MRTPETLTAVQRAERLKQQYGSDRPNTQHRSDGAPTPADSMTAQDRLRESARAALTKGSSNATAGIDPMEEIDGSLTILSINDIDAYKYNPRTKPNPKRAEIKASMAAEGITNLITVTRRSPKEKYFPYGGGNTRVELAKELFAEGHEKFAQITVVTKRWPGEAAVISAHLSENDNRGDISFWERAQGVSAFKREFEREYGRSLSAPELNKELKERGLNYGIKMIQNFGFATDNLPEIGPWLRSEDLNEVLRPMLGALFDVAHKLDVKNQVQSSIKEILSMHGQDLQSTEVANRDLEPSERADVKLDTESLLTDLQSVAAKVLNVNVDHMPALIQAFVQNPKITAEELRKIPLQQQPSSPPTRSLKQAPLGPMLGAVAAKSANRKEPSLAASSGASDTRSTGNESERMAEFSKQLTQDFLALNDVLPIYDFFRAEPALPFGFMVDFPVSMSSVNGHQLSEEQSGLREALWPILATLSGQCNEPLAARCDGESKWTQACIAGPEMMSSKCADSGVLFKKGVMFLTSMHVWMVLSHPRLGPAFSAVLKTLSQFHQDFPEKTQIPFKALFP